MVYFIDAETGSIIDQFSNLKDETIYRTTSGVSYPSHGTDSTIVSALPFIHTSAPSDHSMSYNVHGTITMDYYPEHDYDSPVNTAYETTGIKIYNYVGQVIATVSSNSNGYYSATTSQGIYGIRVPFKNNWVKVTNGGSVVGSLYSVTSGTSVQKDINLNAGDASTVRYHASKIHDYFKNTFSYSSMDYQMEAKINQGSSINGLATGTKIKFGSQSGQNWAQSSDVIYHEYTHNVIYHLYSGWIGIGSDIESNAMDEGLSDYYASTLNNDPNHGESVGVNRDLDNSFSYNPSHSSPVHWNGQVIGGAAWYVRQFVGKTVADKLVFKALQMSPKAHTFSNFMQNMMDADYNYYSGTHSNDIYDAAIVHGINPPLYPAPSVTITGPSTVEENEVGSWSSSVSGGSSPYTYTWYKQYHMQDPFLLTTGPNYAGVEDGTYGDFTLILEVSYEDSKIGYDSHHVFVEGSGCIGLCKQVGETMPDEFTLNQNYPNPFNPSTQIKYALPQAAEVSIKVYNIMGQQVATLVNTNMSAGFHEVNFDAGSLSSGVYIARMEAVGESGELFSDELKMQLIK